MITKIKQGKNWSIAPQYWSTYFEPRFIPMYKRVLDELKLSRRDSLLDAGCGSGIFSNMAIATGASLIGVDAAPGLLEIARSRNPNNSFLEEDLEALPFADNSFNVVTGFNSFQYVDHFESALAEAKRVLVPGGRLVLAFWASPELSDATTVSKAIISLLPQPETGTPKLFALAEEGTMESHFEDQQLTMVHKETVLCPFLYPTLTEGIKSFMGTSLATKALKTQPSQIVEATIARALQPYKMVEGMYYMENRFLVFIAEKR